MARQITALWRLSILLTMAIPAAAQTQTPQAVNVQRLKLRVDRIVPLHGRVVPWSELAAFAAKGGTR